MYGILKSSVNGRHGCYQSDTSATSPDPSPTDPWLFTDPLARDVYQQQGRLNELEDDICTYVMIDGVWTDEELEAKFEFRRLLREGLLIPEYRFGYLSPHPTIYRAVVEGELKITGLRVIFEGIDDVVFEPWLARLTHPGLDGPVRVGRIYEVATRLCLSCDVFTNVCIHCDKTRAIMRQILNYRKVRK